MELHFAKWHGTGNDFILVDDRSATFPAQDLALVRRLCDRHFGIGSDGLILVQASDQPGVDFHMEFFNPDGSKSFCGNGSRCAFAFWSGSNAAAPKAMFSAIDGMHLGAWVGEEVAIALPFPVVQRWCVDGADVDLLNTGSPHELVWVPDVDAVEIQFDGPARRNAARHGPAGSNVNFLQVSDGGLRMRTFERGVEAETLSCGSGVVAAALSAMHRGLASAPVAVRTRGGDLRVDLVLGEGEEVAEVRLIGPVQEVFRGTIPI